MTAIEDRIAPPDGSRFRWDVVPAPTPDAGDGSAAPAPRPPSPIRPLGHLPALDGLRALAVLAVLFFHARFPWAEGGFLGVSAFFTLSGFLITSLLLREALTRDELDVRRFWGRRFRRLLPASWTTIGLVLVMGAVGLWSTEQLRDLRGDVPFALAELLNWHFIAADRSYGAQFAAPSPLEHFWSLAVEQQFYVVLPLLVIGSLALGRKVRSWGGGTGTSIVPLVVVLVAAGTASAVANGVLAGSSVDRAYFGTDTRLAEMVVGALLACALLHGTRLRAGAGRLAARIGAGVALAVTVWLWHVATVDSSWMYPWGLLLTAVTTATLILGAVQGRGIAVLLESRPLRWLGGISYGVYLLHWPVFLWLSPARTGWAPWPLFALRLAVTIAASVVMFRLIEHPVRIGRRIRPTRGIAFAGAAVVVLVLADVVVTRDLPGPTSLEQAAAAQAEERAATTAPPVVPVKALVLGDELAASLVADPAAGPAGPAIEGLQTTVVANPGCGLALGGWVQLADGRVERDPDRCGTVRDGWVAAVAAQHPDVAVVWAGLRDVADRRLAPEQPWMTSTDPAIDDFLRADLSDLLDRLAAASTGTKVVLMSVPHVRNATPPSPSPPSPTPPDQERALMQAIREQSIAADRPPASFAENDDARVDHHNALLAGVAASRGIPFVDAGARLRTDPATEFDPIGRPGGVGVGGDARTALLTWMEPQLRTVVEQSVPVATTPPVAADAGLPPAPPSSPRRLVPPGQRVQISVVGDSVARGYGVGLLDWADGRRDARVFNGAQLGCPIARGGSYRFLRNYNVFEGYCDWSTFFPRYLSENAPDVVVLSSGIWEVVDRRLPGDDRWRHIGQPAVDDYLKREMLSAIDVLASRGASVALLTYPHFQAAADQGYTDLPESDPARVDRLNQIVHEVAALRPETTVVIDLQGWLAQQPGGEMDPAKRQDGLHFWDAYVPAIGDWLGPQLLELAHAGPPPPAPPPAPGG